MSAQIEHLQKKKRFKYPIPTYKRVYSAYVYDQPRYNKIFKKVQELALKYGKEIYERTERYRVLNLCYLRINGKLQSLGDEKHIFRYKVLHKVLNRIAEILLKKYKLSSEYDVCCYLYQRTNIALFVSDEHYPQAEIMDTYNKPLYERLYIHIKLLRLLKLGVEIEDAAELTKKFIKNIEERGENEQ